MTGGFKNGSELKEPGPVKLFQAL